MTSEFVNIRVMFNTILSETLALYKSFTYLLTYWQSDQALAYLPKTKGLHWRQRWPSWAQV